MGRVGGAGCLLPGVTARALGMPSGGTRAHLRVGPPPKAAESHPNLSPPPQVKPDPLEITQFPPCLLPAGTPVCWPFKPVTSQLPGQPSKPASGRQPSSPPVGDAASSQRTVAPEGRSAGRPACSDAHMASRACMSCSRSAALGAAIPHYPVNLSVPREAVSLKNRHSALSCPEQLPLHSSAFLKEKHPF